MDGDENPQPEDYHQYVSAELPDPDRQPRLSHPVASNMVHGPCGSKCQGDGVCSKSYPKDFQDESISSEHGYAVYRRRQPTEPCERTVNVDLGDGSTKANQVGPRGLLLRGRWVDLSLIHI